MDVTYSRDAEEELALLPLKERSAMLHAVEKLIALGDQLPYPHSSGVHGTKLREPRPRGGRSPWRAFYRRVGNQMIIGAIGPEAKVDPAEFRKAVAKAEARIASVEEQENMNDDDNTTNRRRGAR